MKKIVILTNILSPYRIALFDELSEKMHEKSAELTILVMSETESNRNWKYEEFERAYTELLDKRVYFRKADYLYSCPNLISRLEKIAPDIIILAGSYTFFPIWKALRWAKKNKIRHLFWSESHLDEVRDFLSVKRYAREIVRSIFYSQMDGFLYPGEKALCLIKKYNSSARNYIQLPNLIDNVSFVKQYEDIKNRMDIDSVRDKYGVSKEKIVFFSPIRLTHVKGMDLFLKSICECPRKNEFQIVIAGDGEQKVEIERLAKEYGINVLLLGYLRENQVIELHYASDYFLLPSLSDPNPLSCIEAAWCHKPLFVSAHVGNYPEIVSMNANGMVFSYEDISGLNGMFLELLDWDTEKRTHAGEKSFEIAKSLFDIKNVTSEVAEILLAEPQ